MWGLHEFVKLKTITQKIKIKIKIQCKGYNHENPLFVKILKFENLCQNIQEPTVSLTGPKYTHRGYITKFFFFCKNSKNLKISVKNANFFIFNPRWIWGALAPPPLGALPILNIFKTKLRKNEINLSTVLLLHNKWLLQLLVLSWNASLTRPIICLFSVFIVNLLRADPASRRSF